MSILGWLILVGVLWLLWSAVAWRVHTLDFRGDCASGVVMLLLRIYSRLVHRVRVEGRANLPPKRAPGTLIVVSNHSAGVDPLLVQSVCPFEITWMMAEDMRLGWAEPFWKYAGVLFVDRSAGQTMAARQALRLLEKGGVLGIFPEGGIERPVRHLRPFLHGVGLLAARLRAPVLPLIIDGTPDTNDAWASLWTPSRSRIRVMPLIRYDETGLRAGQIADDLHRRYQEWTGWPTVDADSHDGSGSARSVD